MTLIEAIKSGAERIRRKRFPKTIIQVGHEDLRYSDSGNDAVLAVSDILADDWEIEKKEWVGE